MEQYRRKWSDTLVEVVKTHDSSGQTRNPSFSVRHIEVVVKNIRKSQDLGQTLVVDMDLLDQWPEIFVSPLGAVEKPGVDASVNVRTIHVILSTISPISLLFHQPSMTPPR